MKKIQKDTYRCERGTTMNNREICEWIVRKGRCVNENESISCTGVAGLNIGTPCPLLHGEFICEREDTTAAQSAQEWLDAYTVGHSGCDFCAGKESIKDSGFEMTMGLDELYIESIEWHRASFRVHYCPMCGRKLEEQV